MRIPKEIILIIAAGITGIVIGGWLMYLIDITWVYDKVERRKEQATSRLNKYADALDVSHQMVNNCYDAFYTVSKCSTEDGCDLVSTADSLTELNFERKILKLKFDHLLEDTETSWSK